MKRSMAGLSCIAALLCASCLHRVPPQRLATPLPVAVAMLEDRGDETRALPPDVRERISQELDTRNLIVREEEPAALLGGARNSQQRFAALQANAKDASFVLLIETRAVYYDLLEGQYRWLVYSKLTAARRGGQGQPAVDETDIPVFLLYAHEREDAALAAASRVLAERAAALLDGFIAAPREPDPGDSAARPASAALERAPGGAVRALGNIYFAMIDRFANGDASNDGVIDRADPEAFHGGDIQGVMGKLDELQQLGVKTVWLSPVFASRQEKFFGHGAYHGYWVEDIQRVEPRFGDLAALQTLSEELHRRGMKLLLDLVLNHVAFDSPLLHSHPDWFHHQGSIEDWSSPAQLEQRDIGGLPDLAQENEQVYRYLRDASIQWIDRVHPDGFRLDAVKHVPLAFWKRFNADIHAHAGPSFVLLGEALEGDPAKLAALERDGGFDSLFDFPLAYALDDVFCKAVDPQRLGALISLDRLYPDANRMVGMVDNHDLPRVASLCGGDASRVGQALAALAFLRAVPAIQYGTEAGLVGEREPANRGDLFGRADARSRAAVAASLALQARLSQGAARGPIRVLAAEPGALALLRVEDGERASLLLFSSANSHPHSMASLAASLARATAAGCFSWPPHGAPREAGTCPIAYAPGELRVYSLQSQVPGVLSALAATAPRRVQFVLDAKSDVRGAYYVSGAGPELGNWDPARALGPLARAGSARAVAVDLPERSVAEYKLILKMPDGTVQWESGADRFVFLDGAEGPVELTLSWRS